MVRRLLDMFAVRLLVCITLTILVSGCSVVMAARQPSKKDLDVLEKGTPKVTVRSELGRPTSVDDDPGGDYCHETYAFEQGYSGWAKGGRATFHLAADVFTFGLWEIIGTPTELYFDGTEVSLEVLYDENDLVESVCVYSGGEVVETGALVDPGTLRRQLKEAREESLRELELEPATSADSAIVERLSQLKVLLERNLITEQEYEEKRIVILEEFSEADFD
jgi:hypothetical protein